MTARHLRMKAHEIRALLVGTKSQARRIVKLNDAGRIKRGSRQWHPEDSVGAPHGCPYGRPGDYLWVRETWQYAPSDLCHCPQPSAPSPCDDWMNGTGCRSSRGDVLYRADPVDSRVTLWRPAIHMPRWASRITLRITDVRVERLNDISEADARAEGITDGGCLNCGESEPCECGDPMPDARDAYVNLWQSLHGPGSWQENPWVWRIAFRVILANIDQVMREAACCL
mgnify:CR=1 FL=1